MLFGIAPVSVIKMQVQEPFAGNEYLKQKKK